jgi:imidazoleglycerol phosphate synthase glutamine amidotransferase subunit HisH
VIGGAFDGTTTYAIGRVAKGMFITGEETSEAEQPEGRDTIEGRFERLFIDDEEVPELYWGTPKER